MRSLKIRFLENSLIYNKLRVEMIRIAVGVA